MGSLFLSNEELGKKDDDHKPTKIPPIRAQWNAARVPPRKALKRLAIAIAIGFFIYLFVHNIPTDLPIRDRRRPVYHLHDDDPAEPRPMPKLVSVRPGDKSAQNEEPAAREESGYNGPVVFRNLAVSLQAITATTKGGYSTNKNVLFAASSLKSAALLLPMACQMGAELRSYVHFALISRSEIPIDELRAINGVDDSCEIIFHDARPDRSASSTDARLGLGTERALYHINTWMHPQVVLVDSSSAEEPFFLNAMRIQAPLKNIPLIELPENAPKQLAWVSKLDSASLAAWDKINIDILIHASPGASGSLIRLLKSLTAADFGSGSVPHLTIELPHKVDPPTAKFLETFQWPPARVYNPTHARQLTLRHRITRNGLSEEESSVRFLESFWPANPTHSHVLVLSPQAELSPQFFHYLKYAVLEYTCSTAAVLQEWDSRLFGISLDLPSTLLGGPNEFRPPAKQDASRSRAAPADDATTFLWQAPNSNAVLYMGQKWVELHEFVSRLLEFQHTITPVPHFFADKFVSKRYPSWLEHALKLSRARGYWTLYPSQPTASNLATVHHELNKGPEEYEPELERDSAQVTEVTLTSGPLLNSLPSGGSLLPFNEMPLLLWDGTPTTLTDLDSAAADYVAEFRHLIGGCETLEPEDLIPRKSVGDLFCTKDE
ncbi:hypothetical protein B0H63DRAFT_519608 [Podospora didyma]|uniref:Glycosyltransferase 2 n=1 Tax=Podospora didyma TaxID=330526 RepID=A0AAE0U4E0_9PEZI|nr:hypothetical protein B0H63DRAFT_519608 [Podospora didyma]